MKRAVALALLLATGALAAPAPAPASPTLADIEDEVMCPICGTLLELAGAPQADRQRAMIKRLIAEGRSKEEIKEALVAEYGEAVLAQPRGSGFDLSAYLVPGVGFAAAALALAFGVARWRRAARRDGDEEPATPPRGEEAERLEADLARYDL